jgi:hypothetical protein
MLNKTTQLVEALSMLASEDEAKLSDAVCASLKSSGALDEDWLGCDAPDSSNRKSLSNVLSAIMPVCSHLKTSPFPRDASSKFRCFVSCLSLTASS